MLAGRFADDGCPADVSHDTVRVIGVEVIAAAGSDGPRAGPGDALAATAGTSDSPWRDQRANDSGVRRLTQIGWDRTFLSRSPMTVTISQRGRALVESCCYGSACAARAFKEALFLFERGPLALVAGAGFEPATSGL